MSGPVFVCSRASSNRCFSVVSLALMVRPRVLLRLPAVRVLVGAADAGVGDPHQDGARLRVWLRKALDLESARRLHHGGADRGAHRTHSNLLWWSRPAAGWNVTGFSASIK